MKKVLTKEEAKTLLVRYHMINTNDHLKGKEGILNVMERLNSIQQDPLDVVGRNTDLVMQSRVSDYRRNGLESLLYQERLLIDGWDKMMAVYLTKDYPKMEEVRLSVSEDHKHILNYRNQSEALEILDEVLSSLKESPKYGNEIKIGGIQKNRWGQSKLSSAALDYLYYKGVIGVRTKNNTQKQYDLIENLIEESNQSSPFETKEAFIEYYLLRRIKALGICRNKNGVHLSGPYISKKEIRDRVFKSLITKNLIEEIKIEGLKDTYYIPVEANTITNELVDQMSFIAPLDNLIWDRDLIEALFEFKYRWEVYTPQVKREYGYYVLPILYKNSFVGRIEFDHHRGQEKLIIKNVWLDQEELKPFLEEALIRFEHYLNLR